MTDESIKENELDAAGKNEAAAFNRIVSVGKTFLVMFCIFFAVIMITSPIIETYNGLVDADLQVSRASANIKVDLERRADLLPNLASAVKGSAIFEHNTVVETAMARGLAQTGTIREHIAGAKSIEDLSIQNSQLSTLLGNFVKLQEVYPTLQTTDQFLKFEAQVTATENEILMDRQTYNAAVMQYQGACRAFPNVLFAKTMGFTPEKWEMWESPNAARTATAPNITFDDLKNV